MTLSLDRVDLCIVLADICQFLGFYDHSVRWSYRAIVLMERREKRERLNHSC